MTIKQGRRIIRDLFKSHAIHHQRRKIIKAVRATMDDPVSYDLQCRFYKTQRLPWAPRPISPSHERTQ